MKMSYVLTDNIQRGYSLHKAGVMVAPSVCGDEGVQAPS